MSLTRRGQLSIGLVTVLVLIGGAAAAVAVIGGRADRLSTGGTTPPGTSAPGESPSPPTTSPPPPPVCPLSGVTVDAVPARPALAVKVENLPSSRPQTGLSWADIVYEEPVEGGITRFIAVYQCQEASRIEPVRSARLTDVDAILQFGQPLFAYAGAVPKVVEAVRGAGIIDINYNVAVAQPAYHRDPDRAAPHNLYTSTQELYGAAEGLAPAEAPEPLFEYTRKVPAGGVKVTEVHVPFSTSSDVFWKWSASKKVWLRSHGTEPHTLSDGTQVSAKNVIVQLVRVTLTDVTDANNVRSPQAHTVGSGKAYVFRNGRVFVGTWVRDSREAATRFLDADGEEIPLARGNTWIELLPNTLNVTYE